MPTISVKATRKPRVWAASPAATMALGPGARQIARKSATQLSRRPIAKCISRLRAPGGVLLLWQPAQLLIREIADAIEEYKWAVESLVVWDKGRPQPGALDSPYSPQDEHLLVLKRRGDALLNHDNSYRGNILRFAPVSRPGLADAQEHGFEKPVELCKFLIGKHSFERELVVDLCGCTGAMSLAAIEMNRQWVYAESNSANHQIGAGRLAERLRRDHLEAS